MNVIAIKNVRIDSLHLPGDWRKRLTRKSVKRLAESVEELAMLHEPIVRKETNELLTGMDRTAAHVLLKRDEIRVKMVECSDEEALMIRDHENSRRRHNEAGKVEIVEPVMPALQAREKAIKAKGEHKTKERRPGRPKTARGMAYEQEAEARGIRPNSVRTQAWRERAKAEREKQHKEQTKAKDPIYCFGMELDEAGLKIVIAMQQSLIEANGLIVNAQRELTQAMKLPGAATRLAFMKDTLSETANTIRDLVPTMLCPYCKWLEPVTKDCACCEGAGFIGKGKESGVPKELMDKNNLVVLHRTEMVPVGKFVEPPPEPKAADFFEDDLP